MSAQCVSELMEVFFELRDLSDGTRQIYDAAFGRLLAAVGDKPVDTVSPIDAQIFARQLAAGRDGKTPSPTTVNMYTRAVKAFFNWLVASEVLAKSPLRAIRPLRETRRGHRPYENDDVAAMLRHCPDDRWRLMITLAVTAGLRRGEILNLTVGEIDYLAGVITITAKQASAATWPWAVKDGESRSVPITAAAEALLLRVQAALPDGQPYVCLPPQRYRLLAERHRRGTLTYTERKCPVNNFTREFDRICQRAGVTARTFHALRGTCLSVMAENGLQPHELQTIAGHSDVRTTYSHYVRPREQMLAKARNAAYQIGR